MGNKNDDSLEGLLKELMGIPSIGELTARILVENGYDSISKLEDADSEDLSQIEEIGKAKADRIMDDIKGEEDLSEIMKDEFFCVTCRAINEIDSSECEECGEEFNIEGAVILPDQGVIDNPKELLAKFEKDLMDGMESPDVWYGRGAILDSMGFKWEALRSYNKVIEHDPLYDHIWNAKARAALEVGQVRDAARAYKVAFDTHVANSRIGDISSEGKPMEREKKKIKKRDVSVKEVENKLFMARSVIHELKGNEIELIKLNDLLDEAVKARNNDERKKSVEKSQTIISSAEKLREFIEFRDKLNENLDDLTEFEYDIEEFEEEKESLISTIENGYYDAGLDEAYKLKEEIKKTLEEEKVRVADEKEKKERLSEGIKDIRELMKDLRDTALDIDKFKKSFSEIVKDKKNKRYLEGLEKVEDVLETGETILEADKNIDELKDNIEESEFTLEELGFEDDIKKILDLARDGLYHEGNEKSYELLQSFERRLQELEVEKELKSEISENVGELKDKFSELKETSLDVKLIKSMISDAKELKNQGEYEEGINVLKEAIDNTNNLLDFSEDLEKTKSTLKRVNDFNIEYESYKERLKNIKMEAEKGNFDYVFEDIEELDQEMENTIEETVLERKQELENQIDELNELIKDGNNKDISMQYFEKRLDRSENLKDKEEYFKALNILDGLVEKADIKIQLYPMLFSIKEVIDEIKDEVEVEEFKEKISKIKDEYDDSNYDEALRMANDLYEGVIERKDELEKLHELEEEYDEKLSLAKEKLAQCRKTRVNVEDIKELVNQSVEAKKEEDYDKALKNLDKAIERGDRVLRIFDMIKEGADKVNKLQEQGLDHKEYLEHLKDCKKMADISIYEKAERILEEALEDMDEELIEIGEETLEEVAEASEDEIKAMEEELSRSYEKLRQDVEDLKDLYQIANEFDIQVGIGRKLLKLTIKHIREGDYKKATKHLEDGENKILESIERRIDDMVNHVESLMVNVEDKERIESAEEILDEVEDSRENGEYREALDKLHKVREMLKDIQEFDIDERISSLEELVEDADSAGLDIDEAAQLSDDLREMEETHDDDLEDEIESTEEAIKDMINVKIKNKIERARDELENMDIDESQISKPANLLTKATMAQEEGNLKKALSFVIDYDDMIREGLEESED